MAASSAKKATAKKKLTPVSQKVAKPIKLESMNDFSLNMAKDLEIDVNALVYREGFCSILSGRWR